MSNLNDKSYKSGSMSRVTQTFVIFLAAIALVGCQEKKSATAVSRAGYVQTVNGYPVNSSHTRLELNGIVTFQQQDIFNEGVRDMMEAVVDDRNAVGYVSSQGNDGTGVYLGGRVQLRAGPLRAGMNSEVAHNAELAVSVVDRFPGEGDLPPLAQPYMTQAQGGVQGSQADIVFSNDLIAVRLVGQIDNDWFHGEFHYEVRRRADGSPGRTDMLGYFKVPTCRFFICGG